MESRRAFSIGHSILILLVSVQMFSCTFSRQARKSYAAVEKKGTPYDAIIVPGLPYEKDKDSPVMKMRMLWAKHLFDKGIARNVIFSGSAVYTPFVESIAMKAMADSMGIPADNTFSETEAEHSTENVYYSYRLARQLGFRSVALATDPFQSAMLRGFVRKFTPSVDIIPVVYDKINLKDNDLPDIDASNAYREDFVSIKERESFWKRMRGTMGKRVKDERRLEAALREELELASTEP